MTEDQGIELAARLEQLMEKISHGFVQMQEREERWRETVEASLPADGRMSGVNERLVKELMRHKERLREAVYAIAGHPETPERVRVIATSALNDLGERLPPPPGTVLNERRR